MATHTDERTGIDELTVRVEASQEPILNAITLDVQPGHILGLAGETGSGKTTLGLTLLGYLASGLSFAGGRVTVAGTPIRDGSEVLSPEALRRMRGSTVSYVPQDPSSALNPGMKITATFREVMRAHGVTDDAEVEQRIHELFEAVGLPADEGFGARFPHQLSGGQLQRVAIAIAFSLRPSVVVMDEPTTGLDVTTKRRVAELVRRLARDTGAAIVFVSHDLRLLLELSDHVAVLLEGEIVDSGTPAELLQPDRHAYTRRLLQALPGVHDVTGPVTVVSASEAPGLVVESLSARYGETEVTHGVSFAVPVGQTVALVGESGSGKTTTARCVAGFHADYAGQITFDGEALAHSVTRRTNAQKAEIQYVFQNPYGSLNPRRRVGPTIALAAHLLTGANRADAERTARSWLSRVGLRPEHFDALPVQLSGGQRQRVALARALAARPSVLVCDEVTSSLDVSVQREIITLLQEIQQEERLGMLFITHDLALAQWLAHDTLVLLRGEVVESGPSSEVLRAPRHAYTQSLVAAASIGQ